MPGKDNKEMKDDTVSKWLLLVFSLPFSAAIGTALFCLWATLSDGCLRIGLSNCFHNAAELAVYGLFLIGSPLGIVVLTPVVAWWLFRDRG